MFDDLAATFAIAATRCARRRERRRAITRAGVAIAVVVTAIGIGVQSYDTVPASAGVAISYEDGFVQVLLVALEQDPEVIEDAARGAGLDVRVESSPTGPSRVGRFVGDVADSAYANDVELVDGRHGSFAGFLVPVGWEGTLHLRVGRPAIAGEAYASFTDATAPGEPFACLPIDTTTPAALSRLAQDAGVTLRWQVIASGRSEIVEYAELGDHAGRRDGRLVITGIATMSGATAVVTVSDEPVPTTPVPQDC